MKFFRIILVLLSFVFAFHSCKKNYEDRWLTEVKNPVPVTITDISKEFYNSQLNFSDFKSKYQWFLSPNVDDATYERKRTNPEEIEIYNKSLKANNIQTLEKELTTMFARVKMQFPKFEKPEVFVFSSAVELYEEPILFIPDRKLLFIDLSAFLGEKSEFYKGIYDYQKKTMAPQFLLPKIAETIAQDYIPQAPDQNKFIDQMMYFGKLQIVKDAFLPNVDDNYKMNYTKDQENWSVSNETNIWNYFVENDLLFSDDTRLKSRFLDDDAFSKFYTEIDAKSSPRIGRFVGRQIARKFLQENPKVSLPEFLDLPATEIFNKSNYKPKN